MNLRIRHFSVGGLSLLFLDGIQGQNAVPAEPNGVVPGVVPSVVQAASVVANVIPGMTSSSAQMADTAKASLQASEAAMKASQEAVVKQKVVDMQQNINQNVQSGAADVQNTAQQVTQNAAQVETETVQNGQNVAAQTAEAVQATPVSTTVHAVEQQSENSAASTPQPAPVQQAESTPTPTTAPVVQKAVPTPTPDQRATAADEDTFASVNEVKSGYEHEHPSKHAHQDDDGDVDNLELLAKVGSVNKNEPYDAYSGGDNTSQISFEDSIVAPGRIPTNSNTGGTGNLIKLWAENLMEFSPKTMITFYLDEGAEEHHFVDIVAAPVIVQGGFFLEGQNELNYDAFHVIGPDEKVSVPIDNDLGYFRFDARTNGTYTIVMKNTSRSKTQATFALDISKDATLVKEKLSIGLADFSLQLNDLTGSIQTESGYLWIRQKSRMKALELLHSRAYWFVALQTGVLAVVVSIQLYYLRGIVGQ